MKLDYKNRNLEKFVATLSAIGANYGTRAKLVNQRKNELQAASTLPSKEDGGLDWKQVTDILILDIGTDYH